MNAIEAGIYHDLGSGSNVDILIIKKGKHTLYRNIKSDNKKEFSKPGGYKFKKENVVTLQEYKHKLTVEDGPVPMDLSWLLISNTAKNWFNSFVNWVKLYKIGKCFEF